MLRRSLVFVCAGALVLPAFATSATGDSTVVVAAIVKDGATFDVVETEVRVSDAAATVAELEQRTDVVAAGVPGRRYALDTDPRRSEQWALNRLDFDMVAPLASGAGQIVAVVDSGVDASHPDLAGRVLPGTDIITGGDGRNDPNGHGTHVAGIIAANANNGIGVAGYASGVQILPVRVLGADGSGADTDVARGVLWAADNGARIINLSLGGPDPDPLLADAIANVTSRGVVVVAAAGNGGNAGSPPTYPAANNLTLAVAATTASDSRALFSTVGSYVDVAAPGMLIVSTVPGGYRFESGTSMAAPYVSAAIALVMEELGMSAPDAAARVVRSATDVGATGRDDETGAGVIDPYAALTTGEPRERRTAPVLPAPTLPAPGGPIPIPSLPVPPLPVPNLPMPVQPNLPPIQAPAPKAPSAPNPPVTAPNPPAAPVTPPAVVAPKPAAPALPSIWSSTERPDTRITTRLNGTKLTINLSASGAPLARRVVTVSGAKGSIKVRLNASGSKTIQIGKISSGRVIVTWSGDKSSKPARVTVATR